MKSLSDMVLPVINDIRAGRKTIDVSELWGASKALFLFGLRQEARRPIIVVTASEDAAETLAEDLRFFTQKLLHPAGEEPVEIRTFPTWGLLPFEADSPDSRTVGERMRFLYGLTTGNPGVYVVPVPSLMQKLPPWELFVDSVRTITMTTAIDAAQFTAGLTAAGYESASRWRVQRARRDHRFFLAPA